MVYTINANMFFFIKEAVMSNKEGNEIYKGVLSALKKTTDIFKKSLGEDTTRKFFDYAFYGTGR